MRVQHVLKPLERTICPISPSFLCHPSIDLLGLSGFSIQARRYRTRKSPAPTDQDAQTNAPVASVAESADPTLTSKKSQDSSLEALPPRPKRGRKPKALKTESTTPNAPVTLLSRVVSASHNHHDLASFLAHAQSAALSPTSNVYVGTHYEYTVAASLVRLGFDLTRVGGASDLGIDLLGQWALPSLSRSFPAIVQCKASAPQAVFVRELEGAMQSAPPAFKGLAAIGLLAASKPATKGVRDAIARSELPMAFLYVAALDGLIRQFVWNQAAVQKCGLEGLGVALRYPSDEIILTLDGAPLASAASSPTDGKASTEA